MDEAALNRLRFRRQFLFGPRPVSLEGEWQTHRFGTDWVLTAQRDLPLHRGQTADGAEVVLLGFLIDPDFPELTDQQLFERVCRSKSWEELLRAVQDLSGRWALFHISGRKARVCNDAAGLRSIYYAVAGEEPWCFSQPGLYRRVRPIRYLPEAIEFIGARESQKDFEACFPAASSPYAEVAHLLTNHYLDLETRATTRFWPTARLEPLDLQTAVEKAVPLFQQSMRAITLRGPAAFAVTAGRDSRTLLAASRAVADRLWAHTVIYGELNLASPDLRIASELCRVAGLTHHTLRCPKSMGEPFQSVFLQNHDPAHRCWGRISQGVLDRLPENAIWVRGNVSEVVRCVYYGNGVHPESLDGADLARRCKMPVSDFTRRHFDAWLREAESHANLGYKLLSLFFLEHRMANWLAASQTQYDIVCDTFSPYANRRLYSLLLATPVGLRVQPQCVIYHELIRRMWPELLQFPFNPPNRPLANLLHKVRKAGGQLGALFGWRPLHVRLEWHGPQAAAAGNFA